MKGMFLNGLRLMDKCKKDNRGICSADGIFYNDVLCTADHVFYYTHSIYADF